jgi:ABC-type sugar transport system ATPase subunit
VLSELSFTIAGGEHIALLGPSGCGKSTTLRLMAGLEAPSAGQILLDGNVVSETCRIRQPPHRLGIAMVFQDLALWPNLTVKENVLLGLAGAALSRREAAERAREALALCAIETWAERQPGHISGGQQQRVALARAIAARPAFLLLDEPFAGLDLILKTQLLKEIAGLAARRHLTVLLVTHDPVDALTLCRSAILLNNGRVEATGLLRDLVRTSEANIFQVFREHLGRWSSLPGAN